MPGEASPLFGAFLEVWENQHRKHRFRQGRVAIVRIWDVSKFCLLEVLLEFEKRAITYPCPRVSSCCVNEWFSLGWVSHGHRRCDDVRRALEVFTALGRSRECPAVARTKKTPQMIYSEHLQTQDKAIVARSIRELWDDTSTCHHVMPAIITCLFGCRTSLWSSTTCVQHTRQGVRPKLVCWFSGVLRCSVSTIPMWQLEKWVWPV